MEKIQKLIDYMNGKKTYVIAITIGLLGLTQAFGLETPEFVYTFLTAIGLGSVRHAFQKNDSTKG